MSTNAIPTLGDQMMLTDPSTQLTYLIRTYAIIPKHSMPILMGNIRSLAIMAAQYGRNADRLQAAVLEDLTALLNKNFPQATNNVTVTHEANEDDSYDLIMSATLTINGTIVQADYRRTIKNNQVVLPNDTVDLSNT